jgi:hypothetical protein
MSTLYRTITLIQDLLEMLGTFIRQLNQISFFKDQNTYESYISFIKREENFVEKRRKENRAMT